MSVGHQHACKFSHELHMFLIEFARIFFCSFISRSLELLMMVNVYVGSKQWSYQILFSTRDSRISLIQDAHTWGASSVGVFVAARETNT